MLPVVQSSIIVGNLSQPSAYILGSKFLIMGINRHYSMSHYNKLVLNKQNIKFTKLNVQPKARDYHKSSICWYEHKLFPGQYQNLVCGSNKVKVIGSVVAEGALGAGAYRWMFGARYQHYHRDPINSQFNSDEQFPDPRKFLKEYTKRYSEYQNKQPSSSYAYPAPHFAWEAFHSLFPGLATRNFHLQQTTSQIRQLIQNSVQTELKSSDSPLNIFVVTALNASTQPINVDSKSIKPDQFSIEPFGQVQFNPLSYEVHTEWRAKYTHENQVRYFLIKAQGQGSSSDNHESMPLLNLNNLEVTCLQTWRTITLNQ